MCIILNVAFYNISCTMYVYRLQDIIFEFKLLQCNISASVKSLNCKSKAVSVQVILRTIGMHVSFKMIMYLLIKISMCCLLKFSYIILSSVIWSNIVSLEFSITMLSRCYYFQWWKWKIFYVFCAKWFNTVHYYQWTIL